MSMLLKVCSNVKSEINLVLTLLHTVSRSCKGRAKQNCSSFQNAAVESFLALLSVLTADDRKQRLLPRKEGTVIHGFG